MRGTSRGIYFSTLGVALYRAGNYKNAIAGCEQSGRQTPSELQLDNGLPNSMYHKLNNPGDESAACFEQTLPDAYHQSDNVIVLMHVPPFREACWDEEQTSDDNWAPHFVCHAAGEVLKKHAAANPNKRITVLCGHTHDSGMGAFCRTCMSSPAELNMVARRYNNCSTFRRIADSENCFR